MADDDRRIDADTLLHRELVRGLVSKRLFGTGQRFTGFELERVLGRGGMGTVVEADDRLLARPVALKVAAAASDSRLSSLVSEARTLANLEHPSIVPVYELGENREGYVYFAMRVIRGTPLSRRIRAVKRPLSRSDLLDLLDVAIQVCQAIGYAHSKGVVHCDLKPDNIMTGEFGEVYVVDWGVASRITGDGEISSKSGGTPEYMAPEQLGEGGAVSERTDIYLIGALLYEILTGSAPFTGRAASETTAVEPPVIDRSVPAELRRITARAMAADPAERYDSATALRADLVEFARGSAPFPVQRFDAGAEIVRQGEPGSRVYVIQRGQCRVVQERSGAVKQLRTLSAGDVFGEMAAIDQRPRSATVIATTEVEVAVVERDELLAELGQMKPWVQSIIRAFSAWLRDREAEG